MSEPNTYAANPTASRFHESVAKTKVLWGPLGTGKSSAALMEWVLQCSESVIPLRGVVIRSSYRELMDTTKKTIEDWFGKPGMDILEWRHNDAEFKFTLPSPHGDPLTHTLMFRSIGRVEETSKLTSMELAFAWLEECVPAYATNGTMGAGLAKGVYEVAFSRLRQKDSHRYTIVCTANPPNKSHWFYKTFIEPPTEQLEASGVAVFYQDNKENAQHLPANYYDDMRRVLDPDLVRRFVDGEVLALYDGERVFPECNESWHVTDKVLDPDPRYPLILGFDWGLTPATLITQVVDGQWRWIYEVQSFNMAADQHCERLRDIVQDGFRGYEVRCWGDPAGSERSQADASSAFQVARSFGFEVQGGAFDWPTRRESVKQRLLRTNWKGEPALLISRADCSIAAEAMLGGYRYPKSADGRIGHRPIKNHFSHIMDAAQYVASREFQIIQTAPRELDKWDRHIIKLPPLDPFRPSREGPPEPKGGGWMGN